MSAPDLADLTKVERGAAESVVWRVAELLEWERVEILFQSLARGEALVIDGPQASTLSRPERALAAGVITALTFLLLEQESVERVIAFLGEPDGPHEAFTDSILRRQQAATERSAAQSVN